MSGSTVKRGTHVEGAGLGVRGNRAMPCVRDKQDKLGVRGVRVQSRMRGEGLSEEAQSLIATCRGPGLQDLKCCWLCSSLAGRCLG